MKSYALAAVISGILSVPAFAATVIYQENGPAGLPNPDAPAGAIPLGEFSNGTGNPLIVTNGDDVDIYGSVSSRATTTTQWKDGWTMDFGALTYSAVFSHSPYLGSAYDAVLAVSGIGTFGMSGTGSFNISGLTGVVTFQLDPIDDTVLGDGATDNREDMLWNIQTTAPSAVPLPAGAALGLTGIGALAMMRRRKKA